MPTEKEENTSKNGCLKQYAAKRKKPIYHEEGGYDFKKNFLNNQKMKEAAAPTKYLC